MTIEKGLILTTKKNAVTVIEDRGGAKTIFRYYGPGKDRLKGGKTKRESLKYWVPITESPIVEERR